MKNRIVMARERAGFNQKELAHILGISPATLNGYEKGNHDPKSDGLVKIAKSCNVTTDFLLGLSDNIEKQTSVSNVIPKIEEIIKKANQLNKDGLSKLNDYADDLVSSGKYKKVQISERAM